jgi:MOSC domain-containing protein YiiM
MLADHCSRYLGYFCRLFMKVISTNLGAPQVIKWRGKNVQTGIYKYPVNQGIYLGETDVKEDAVVDRKYHGGIDKACYLFSADVYESWKLRFPKADWSLGMFGENLTVQGLDERNVYIGDQYEIGESLVEVSEPREPCFKLGVRFGTQTVLKQCINSHSSGVYVRVLRNGKVVAGDAIKLIKREQNEFSLARIYWLRYHAALSDVLELKRAMQLDALAASAKRGLGKRLVLLS